MGVCDYRTGKCRCRDGFYGEACEYSACGGGVDNACSGHGRCMSMAELALWANDNGDATEYVYGNEFNNFATWDFDRVHGCLCDPGFRGYDCSLIDCPIGDDPGALIEMNACTFVRFMCIYVQYSSLMRWLQCMITHLLWYKGTYDDHAEVQLLQCIADTGNFTLSFRQHVTPKLSYNITAAELREALISLPSIVDVGVTFIYDSLPPNGTLNYVKPAKTQADGFPEWGGFIGPNKTFIEHFVYIDVNATENTTFCRTDGTQIAIIHFEWTHGDLPEIIPDVHLLGETNQPDWNIQHKR